MEFLSSGFYIIFLNPIHFGWANNSISLGIHVFLFTPQN
uniref:Uncharacterized protein n=1 Tax=Siphoviridae sp. ctKwY15 TaxID=2827843 RepID=A0A8S5SU01_9CAUD|nr:MAG TPA: hypothetical protein [Siphoviridae sp. ctKwY15]